MGVSINFVVNNVEGVQEFSTVCCLHAV